MKDVDRQQVTERWRSGWLRSSVWQDLNHELAGSLNYASLDSLSVRLVWWHWVVLLGLVWLNEIIKLPDYLPSPLGWHSLQPVVASLLLGGGFCLCLFITLAYKRVQNRYLWRIGLVLSLGVFSCFYIIVTSGSVAMHFHFFIVMAYSLIYADWRLVWWVCGLANVYILTFNYLDPELVYSYGRNDLSLLVHGTMLVAMALVITFSSQKYRETVVALQQAKQRNDEFLAIASHELKTPLTSVKGYTQVLQQRLKRHSDPVASDYASKIYHQLNRLIGLVRDLLDVSRIQSGKMEFRQERIGIDGLIREVVDEVQALSPRHVIKVEGRAYTPVWGDRSRLYQVLLNLLLNAVKYSPGQDTVFVRVVEARDKIVVSVQDFGMGIAIKDQQRIFEPYFRSSDVQRDELPGGLGMGLYICSEIVQLHQGRMWVESEVGKGSTFSFYLPLAETIV